MPIAVDDVRGAALPATEGGWTPDDVILYHLAVGAGHDPDELEYAYERHLKVLPSFGVLPALGAMLQMLDLPGMDVDMRRMLHGEQELELHGALPAEAKVRTTGRVADVLDKGKGALVVVETVTAAEPEGRPLVTNRFAAFFRGEGGFGGPAEPSSDLERPDRKPDHLVRRETLPWQALLYRLSGDKNPLHADPEAASRAGLERPILHGLCTYGIVCKAVADAVLGGDVSRIVRYRARFTGVVYPGEALDVSIWDEGDRLLIDAESAERRAPVLRGELGT